MNGRMFEIIVTAVLLHFIALGKGCHLEYEKNVSNRPTMFLTTAIHSSVCGIQNDGMNSVTEWHDPNSTVRGLNYDSQQMRLLYLSYNFYQGLTKLMLLDLKSKQPKVAFDQSELTSIDGTPVYKSLAVADMTYDWITKNAYLNLREFIVAVNIQNPFQGTRKIISNPGHILSLAVHPNAGYLFYVNVYLVYTDNERKVISTIYRAHLDGSNAVSLVQSEDYIISLAIDFYEDRLYWAVPGQSLIEHSKLDGTDVRTISGRKVRFNMFNDGSRSIDVDQDYVYYLPANATSVRRFRKGDKQDDVDFELHNDKRSNEKSPITEILVLDSKKQTVRESHPCVFGNGGCEKFCFAAPENGDLVTACRCDDDEYLGVDRTSCEKRNFSVTPIICHRGPTSPRPGTSE